MVAAGVANVSVEAAAKLELRRMWLVPLEVLNELSRATVWLKPFISSRPLVALF